MTNESNTSTAARFGLWGPNATVFIASGCIMIIEIVAGRIVSQFLGQSLYTWTTIIGVVLAGISVGNYLGGWMADRFTPRRILSVMFIVASAGCVLVIPLNHLVGEWRLLWLMSWPARIFWHVTITFIVPSVVLGTISPLVAKIALERNTHVGQTIGGVYAWGAAGSIAGTFLAGYLLIAWMGTIAVVCVVALILAIMAVVYGRRSAEAYVWLIAWGAAAYLSMSPHASAKEVGTRWLWREQLPEATHYFNESQYNRIVVKGVGDEGVRALYLDKLMHSKIDPEHPAELKYEYSWIYAAFTGAFKPADRPLRSFVIGGGGYTYPQYMEKAYPDGYVEVAEIDPAVTEAAYEAFGFRRDSAVAIYHMDARHRVKDLLRAKNAGEDVPLFDFVYGDTFNDFSVPYHLTTREFNDELSALMTPGGIYLLNLIDIFDEGRFLASVVATCRKTFPAVHVFAASGQAQDRETFVVACMKKEQDIQAVLDQLVGNRARSHHVVPEELEELLARAKPVVLTDHYAPVENLLAVVVRKNRGKVVHALAGDAIALAQRGDLDGAVRVFKRSIELNPRVSSTWFNLGIVYDKKEEWALAFESVRHAVELDPFNTKARNFLAYLNLRNGDVDAAINQWLMVLQIDPELFAAHVDIASAYARQGNLERAMVHWTEALSIDAESVPVLINLGSGYAGSGDHERAVVLLGKALTLQPDEPETMVRLADGLVRLGRLEEAQGVLTRMGVVAPDHPQRSVLQGLVSSRLSEKPAP